MESLASIHVPSHVRSAWIRASASNGISPYRESLTGSMLPEIKGPIYTFQLPARTASLWKAQ